MLVLSTLGVIVLVLVIGVGAYWLVNNVSFKQSEKKEDTK